jgi:outer membrane protein
MNRIFSLSLVALAAFALPRAARADIKIGYVDLQRVLTETDDGKQATSKLKADFEKKQKDLDARQEELKKLKGDLDKQQAILKPEALAQKQGELQQKLVQLQETYMRLQKDLAEKEEEAKQRIIRKTRAVAAQIAQAEGFAFILEANTGLLYAPASNDLTNELIRKYNAHK